MSGSYDVPRQKRARDLLREISEAVAELDTLYQKSGTDPKPPPDVARHLLNVRSLRAVHFDGDLFRDPVWDVLLSAYLAEASGRRLTIGQACRAAAVPPGTATRYLQSMEHAGLITRASSSDDSRITYVSLSDDAYQRLSALLTEIGTS
jgi:DNA-binding MarR family transcriptional regulator